MNSDQIVEKFGKDFDEVRQNRGTESFTAYLTDGRRATAKTMREALETLLSYYDNQGTTV